MLCDECIYLCQNILQQQNAATASVHPASTTTTLTSWMEQRLPMLRTCLSTAAELAYLLSSKKNRRTLFFRQQLKRSRIEGTNSTNNDPLLYLLNVFAGMSSFIQDEMTRTALKSSFSNTENMDTSTVTTGHDDDSDSRNIPKNNTERLTHQSPSDVSVISLRSCNNITKESATLSEYNIARQQLLDALGMCVYFLSFDCTLSGDSMAITGSLSGNSSTAAASKVARRIRKAILCHDGCIRGILHLIISDPFILCLRGFNNHNHVQGDKDNEQSKMNISFTQLTLPLPSVQIMKEPATDTTVKINDNAIHTRSTTDTPTSVASSLPLQSPSLTRRNGNAVQTPDLSVDSTNSIDPTLLGRLQRKRRRLEEQQQNNELTQSDDDISFRGMEVKSEALLKGDSLSFTTNTPSPLRKQWKSSFPDDLSVTSSNDIYMTKIRDKMDHVTSLIHDHMQSVNDNKNEKEFLHLSGTSNQFSKFHSCNRAMTDSTAYTISSVIQLVSLTRIITGKIEGGDDSCMDDDNGQGEDGKTDLDEYNPLLESNQMLCACGAIPLLSQALSESLAAVSCQLKLFDDPAADEINCSLTECTGCITALSDRVTALAQLIDGASLLSSSNREQFCLEGYTNEAGGFLMIALLTVLKLKLKICNMNKIEGQVLFDGVWDETILNILKMLTSLTHENMTAARELEAPLVRDRSVGLLSTTSDDTSFCGVYVIADVLQHATKQMLEARSSFNSHQDGKLLYDAIIFCLNILANFIESGGSCRTLAKMSILQLNTGAGTSSDCIQFLQWLTRWLVDETVSFREAVVESTFGSSPSKHQDRQLDAQEDEKLVIAGNGFVLLCCLLIDDDKSKNGNRTVECSDGTSESAAYIILNELPGTSCDSKLKFMKNTLKAFCNFYHFSIGDLSLAIVAPVKQLIKRLDNRFEDKAPMHLEVSD